MAVEVGNFANFKTAGRFSLHLCARPRQGAGVHLLDTYSSPTPRDKDQKQADERRGDCEHSAGRRYRDQHLAEADMIAERLSGIF